MCRSLYWSVLEARQRDPIRSLCIRKTVDERKPCLLDLAEYVVLYSFSNSLKRSFSPLPTTASLVSEIARRCECFYTFRNTSFARLFKFLSIRNIICNLQTRSQNLFSKGLSTCLNERPSVSEKTAEKTSQTMTTLHASTLEHGHSVTTLIQIIIFIVESTRVTAKLFFHCRRYGILQRLKCSVTITFPLSNATGLPVSLLISTSMLSKLLSCSGTYSCLLY